MDAERFVRTCVSRTKVTVDPARPKGVPGRPWDADPGVFVDLDIHALVQAAGRGKMGAS